MRREEVEVRSPFRYSACVNPHQPLIDELYLEEVLRAREETMEHKFLMTFELSDLAMEFGRAGVRAQLPGATQEEWEKEWQRRLRIARELDDDGRYVPVR